MFKALPIEKKGKKQSATLMKDTIQRGFVFAPEVIYNYGIDKLQSMIDNVEQCVGLSSDKMNNAFHKSWNKIKDTPLEQLYLEQLIHYFTTYGFESTGSFSHDTVYIPAEKLKIPKVKVEQIPLVVVRGYTWDELKDKVMVILQSGIALSQDTMNDIMSIIAEVKMTDADISSVKNKEVKIMLYDKIGIVPGDPVEFLRYVIFKVTGQTLLIKSKGLIYTIKKALNAGMTTQVEAKKLFTKYDTQYGIHNLGEVFLRFKPLFLAFRGTKDMNHFINRIRKASVENHKPMDVNYLNNVTSMISNGKKINKSVMLKELDKVNIFRKARLAYALKFRSQDVRSIMYRIRNGKSYAKEFDFHKQKQCKMVYTVVRDSIIKDIAKNVKGKKIFIPSYMQYALPTTEKQFTNNFPAGSYVSVPKDIVFGVHWTNLSSESAKNRQYPYDHGRVDLDLGFMTLNGKFGWDASYRSIDGGNILFSGDMTDAPLPKGASEFFAIKRQDDILGLVTLNWFTYGYYIGDEDDQKEVPFEIILGSHKITRFTRDYIIDPNNVIAVIKSKITDKQKVLGVVISTPEENRFYFTESNIGQSISARCDKDYIGHARNFIIDYYGSTITLNRILQDAGAIMVDKEDKCDINLSPEKLEKDTFISLLLPSKES